MSEESSESAELNTDPGDIDPGFGAGLGGFVIAHESPLTHEPAEGAFHNPAARQHFEADGIVGAFDDLDHELGAQPFDPLGERGSGVAAIHPQDAEPGEPAQDPTQNHLCPVTFGGVGWGHGHAEHQPQRVHQQMALATFDPLAGVRANAPTMTVGLHTLAVENGGRWPRAFALGFADEGAEHVVEHCPLMVERPLPEDMVDGLPRRKIRGQITPRAATLDDIEYGIDNAPPVNGWASAFGAFGEQRLEVCPLGIRKTGLIDGVFHAPTEAALKISRLSPSPRSTHRCTILPRTAKQMVQTPSRYPNNPIIQTATYCAELVQPDAKLCKHCGKGIESIQTPAPNYFYNKDKVKPKEAIPSSNVKYYFSTDTEQHQGPVDESDLKLMRQDDLITDYTLVIREGDSEWRSYRDYFAQNE